MSWQDIIKGQRPDYPDLDGDGDTEEPMVDALETVEQVESVKKEENFVVSVGDFIQDKKGRYGQVTSISIAMTPYDPAGENKEAADVQLYHTVMDYKGAISFGNYWCYLNQIAKVTKAGEKYR
tara:strand:- start:24 stop:392 length:369 start_codon:yes stop_codon:yes gene_type:complete